MVWPIDAQKGRLPSKIAHSRTSQRTRSDVVCSISPTDRHPHRLAHRMHYTAGALLPATVVFPPLRAASGRCSRAVDAGTARCNLQHCRRLLRCSSRHRPVNHCQCAPCVRSASVNQGGRGSAWELRSRRSNNTSRGRSRRTQTTAADRPTAARGPASGCSVEVLFTSLQNWPITGIDSVEVLAAILYGEAATPAK